jgi:sugar lactone lactonase YvrE
MTIEIDRPLSLLADGLHFTECPRWHSGRLYFSDMTGKTVYSVGEDGGPETVCKVAARPGGLGFAPNGDLLISAMDEGRILRMRDGKLSEYANLSKLAPTGINDMIVSPEGRCYVGRYCTTAPIPIDPIFVVDKDGSIRESADGFEGANGMVLTADGKRLIVAESAGRRLAILDIAADGSPVGRRTFADLPPDHFPDGICGDDQGGIWVSCAIGPGVVRVEEGGNITHQITIGGGRFAFACTLGGSDGQTLFICTSKDWVHERTSVETLARIESVRVPFRQAGTP